VQKLFADVEESAGPVEVCLFNAGSNSLPVTLAFWLTARPQNTWSRVGMGPSSSPAQPARRQRFRRVSAAKFGLRAVAQAMARELGPKNIHISHLLIDAGVDSEEIRRRLKAGKGLDSGDIREDSLTKTSSIADAYWFLHTQKRWLDP
jgi:hypothetical protein